MPIERVATIGVYGFNANSFFAAITDARVDFFCDVRARRGVRGRDYAFANARRLEAKLDELGIPYRHFPELAPTREIRELQRNSDATTGVTKRQRDELSPAFINAYLELLAGFAAREELEAIRGAASAPMLMCVELLPDACHRSLVASHLASSDIPIDHVLP